MDLKKNAPKGEFLAYINKEEAAMLKKAGGSGKLVNGIPSFRPEDFGQERRAQKARAQGTKTVASNPYAGAGQGSKSDFTVKDDGRGYTTETQDYNTYLATGENPLGPNVGPSSLNLVISRSKGFSPINFMPSIDNPISSMKLIRIRSCCGLLKHSHLFL